MSLRVLTRGSRCFSTVSVESPFISVISSASGKSDAPAIQTGARSETLDRLDRAFLYESLNTTKKRMVFRETRARSLESADPIIVNGQRVTTTKYPGLPAVKDLTTLILTSESAEELAVARGYFESYAKYDNTKGNLKTEHFSELLRKSAELGAFDETLQYILTNQDKFRTFLNRSTFLEVLRITALRVPHLTARSQAVVKKYYQKARHIPSSDLVLLYAAVQSQKAFGKTTIESADVITRATAFAKSEAFANVSAVDLALGLEAAKELGPQAVELLSLLEAKNSDEGDAQKVIYKVKSEPRPKEDESSEAAEAETDAASATV